MKAIRSGFGRIVGYATAGFASREVRVSRVRFRVWVALVALSTILAAIVPLGSRAGEVAVSWVDAQGRVLAERKFDLDDFDALEQHEIATSTPWTEGRRRFTGPSLRALSGIAGLQSTKAELHALNDYSVEVPRQDWSDYDPILASRIDGRPPRIFEKGPYWLIYPVDTLPTPLPQRFVARMIWQVDRITFYVE